MRRYFYISLVLMLGIIIGSLSQPAHVVHAQLSTVAHRVLLPSVLSMPSQWNENEIEVLHLINQHRHAAGCPPAQINRELSIAAKTHSQDMAKQNYFSHTGPDGRTYQQRALAAAYQFFASGEVIAAGYNTPTAVVDGWMNSQNHRSIILTCANSDIGIGVATGSGSQWQTYWTSVFGHS